jgi:HTH-type transcriptional regulator/antitoxin MqsA
MPDVKQCPICEGEMEAISVEREVKVGARTTTALDQFFRCQACEEEVYLPGQMDATLKRASDKIRAEEGLLLPGEIRGIRERLGLTQSAFEVLLDVGPKTVVRWEKGTVFQNSSTNTLLVAVRDLPGMAEFLARRHGIDLQKGNPMETANPMWSRGDTHLSIHGSKSQKADVEDFGDLPVGPTGRVRIGRA